ncbi:putative oxidoreductase [Selenomonas ruminantium subsp. lactilytica TAM6421]|uniref:NADP-dependent 3-hydroxy acid dehydrogenase YdfG n=1 Tax=Selenomonas ruminantium subsp. lactilytica (strain NBRC 103574 / TAM6421) TaxID=927704 RepID=I0GQJ8_SELRL|nr:SDR family NAD(P)-dependent oxidoreductase [Selenomonas ruminantium]BAL83035.1 putative oxidoreductase [Selenomonas ruminantium subsp. lactilytica TAM6421]
MEDKKIAIITGASSGLGAEYARLLDKEGLAEIWLIARRKDRLETLTRTLETKCRCLVMDLTDEEALNTLETEVAAAKMTVAYLVNAAGFGCIGLSRECSREKLQQMVKLNDMAALAITEICIPYMEKGSIILQIASCSAFQPIPNLAVYAASKAFLLSYSRALSVELQDTGIQVTAVCPFWIKDTEFVDKAKETDKHEVYRDMPGATNAKHVAETSLRAAKAGTVVCTPDPVSTVHRIVASILPHWMLARICK